MSDIEAGRVTAVIAWGPDRLTRNARDRLRLLELGKEHAVILALVRGSDLDLSTPAGRLTADILGSVAQHEIDQKADRQRRAALQRSEMGKPPSGVRLTGYTTSGEVVEAEAVYIRQLFTRFAEGDSLRALAAWQAESGVPTRHGARWHALTSWSGRSHPGLSVVGAVLHAWYTGRKKVTMTALRDARAQHHWSQSRTIAELQKHARSLGVTLPGPASLKTELSRWENGHEPPTRSTSASSRWPTAGLRLTLDSLRNPI